MFDSGRVFRNARSLSLCILSFFTRFVLLHLSGGEKSRRQMIREGFDTPTRKTRALGRSCVHFTNPFESRERKIGIEFYGKRRTSAGIYNIYTYILFRSFVRRCLCISQIMQIDGNA